MVMMKKDNCGNGGKSVNRHSRESGNLRSLLEDFYKF